MWSRHTLNFLTCRVFSYAKCSNSFSVLLPESKPYTNAFVPFTLKHCMFPAEQINHCFYMQNRSKYSFYDASAEDYDNDDISNNEKPPEFPPNLKHPGYKDFCVHCETLQAFKVAQAALQMKESEMDEFFYNALFRINKKRVGKRAVKVTTGDIVDLVVDVIAKDLTVKRVEVLYIDRNKNEKGRMKIWLRRWKRLKLNRIIN
ncbi:uncharacterized protein LOC143461798 [Clavelina lepadiformis]|uniref:uncharacterized protein LOC143461798 n=1 Tax=Clavelina lepadiformis TaxID=159417 RepID=UPI0040431BCA